MTPYLVAMLALLCVSAFLSSSEAAYFSLSLSDKEKFASGNLWERTAASLLERPDRLLGTILLGNLVVNLTYFTLSSIIAFGLQQSDGMFAAMTFAAASLLVVMVFAEMLPKDLAVLAPRGVAKTFAMPLSLLLSIMRPVIPALHWGTLLSKRLWVPQFEAESTLHPDDFHRTVTLAQNAFGLQTREQQVLKSIVSLSEVTAEKLMQPRVQLVLWRYPLDLRRVVEELRTTSMRRDFIFIAEDESDEIASAIPINALVKKGVLLSGISGIISAPRKTDSDAILYVPWSATAASLWEQLRQQKRRVAAITNEYGETIGIVTEDDIWRFLLTEKE